MDMDVDLVILQGALAFLSSQSQYVGNKVFFYWTKHNISGVLLSDSIIMYIAGYSPR